MNEAATFMAAFTVGLLGNVHCLGMCGGIATAIGVTQGKHRLANVLLFNGGRVLSYCLLGGTIGVLGHGAVLLSPAIEPWLRIAAGLLLIAMGLYINQWWMGLTALERIGAHAWNPIKPILPNLPRARVISINYYSVCCGVFYHAV